MAKQIVSIILLITGVAMLLGLSFFALDNATSAEPEGLGTWISTALGMLLSAGAGIAAWLNLKKSKNEAPPAKTELKDNSKYFEKVEHYHEAPQAQPETHDTIGFIPPVKAATYVPRGRIEDDVFEHLKQGKSGAIVGVHAPGGLGKTELAKQAAEKLKDEFEILWVDVGGKKPQQVAGDLLIKCGIQMQPGDAYERMVNELRHAFQSHKFFVILDDVRQDALERIGDFLPPKPSVALVTSRIQQIGGVTRSFALDTMTWEQAKDLFNAILGNDVVENEVEAVRSLADRCKLNPLAMEIAARRIRQFAGVKTPVAKYFEIARTKFAELKIEGDARWDMETIFDISYSDLSADDRERFNSLAAFHPSGFSIQAVSHLWKVEESDTRKILSRFINLSLVKIVESDGERYRLHDLLDEYGASKLKTSEKEVQVKAALAEWLAGLFNSHYTMKVENFPVILPERDNLLLSCEWASERKQADLLASLTTNARNWFYISFTDSWAQWYAWLEASLQMGLSDKNLTANVRQAIGDVQQFRKENDAALESYNEALKLFQAVGDRLGEANVRKAIGDVQQFRDERDAALESYNEALKLFQAVGDRLGEANVRKAIGDVQQFRKENDAALESYNEALKLFKEIGAKLGEANVYLSLGGGKRTNKDFAGARTDFENAFKVYRAIGDQYSQARALYRLGDCLADEENYKEALSYFERASQLWDGIGVTDLVESILKPRIEEAKKHL